MCEKRNSKLDLKQCPAFTSLLLLLLGPIIHIVSFAMNSKTSYPPNDIITNWEDPSPSTNHNHFIVRETCKTIKKNTLKINLEQIYKPASQPSPIHLLWLKQELLLRLRTDLHKLFNALLVPRPLETHFLLTLYTPSTPLGLQLQ